MQNEILTYSAVNRKSVYVYFLIVIMLGFSGVSMWFGYILIKDGLLIYSLITLPFILLFPLVLLHFIKSRILLTHDAIIRESFFGKKVFKYKDIKTFKRLDTIGGGYGMTTFIETEEAQSNSKDILSIKQIYISDNKNSHPNKFGRGNRLLFNETGDLYERIKEKITAANKVFSQ